ncbi:arsenical pump-driving ATPase [Ideonella paludis]|uniref:arsenical pump-driving ATPase n=1 Tax=Ideonella paludis TaxID=1233411 RepID=UPI003631DF3A
MNTTTSSLGLLQQPPRFLFFTGKGGVGKTSLACASAIALADAGRRVLIVSTDPASNLDEMLGLPLKAKPQAVPGVRTLWALNIDPERAAEAYRDRVLAQMSERSTLEERRTVHEQLSGACTTEIAAFDEFVALLADPLPEYDHIVFDTAPTGHTLRLLSLPKAWSGFLEGNDRGASCLGPHSGLKMQEARFRAAMQALAAPERTRLVLVTRADASALKEAARTHHELQGLGLSHLWLAVNGRFMADPQGDAVAAALQCQQAQALADMPQALKLLPRDDLPLKPFDMVGLPALRALLQDDAPLPPTTQGALEPVHGTEDLCDLVDRLAQQDHALVMVMGKGGVGKTTVAAALAVALADRGKSVHLSTTDPAAHLTATLGAEVPGLQVDRIDPVLETERYIDKMMATRAAGLSAEQQALMLEDLRSPCTEEVAVFHAFSRTVAEARSAFVVLDTAPTGHTLLLMDATGAYHRQVVAGLPDNQRHHFKTPLTRLQDAAYTHIVLVTLPETTPVSEAAALQEDLRRAQIEPSAWVVNRSLLASGSRHPMLLQRLAGERAQLLRVSTRLAAHTHVIAWQATPPVGVAALRA